MYSFPYLEPVCCSVSSSNCCFLTCIQISQEADKVMWYSHLLKNFPQFGVMHKVKGFNIVNKAIVDVFLECSCFFDDPADVVNLISGSSVFSKSSLNIWKFMVQNHIHNFFLTAQSQCQKSIPILPGKSKKLIYKIIFDIILNQYIQFSSVQSLSHVCDPMDCSTPGLPVHYLLPEQDIQGTPNNFQ